MERKPVVLDPGTYPKNPGFPPEKFVGLTVEKSHHHKRIIRVNPCLRTQLDPYKYTIYLVVLSPMDVKPRHRKLWDQEVKVHECCCWRVSIPITHVTIPIFCIWNLLGLVDMPYQGILVRNGTGNRSKY